MDLSSDWYSGKFYVKKIIQTFSIHCSKGQVNSIAPIISNFFIASFCLVNITCFHASFVGSPSFRPTFKYYNKWISLLTGLVCIVIMFFLDWISAIITVVLMVLIYFYISKKGPGTILMTIRSKK